MSTSKRLLKRHKRKVERAKANVALNGFDLARCEFVDADVNESLRRFIADGQSFDAIVLDPPKLAPNAAAARSDRRVTCHMRSKPCVVALTYTVFATI